MVLAIGSESQSECQRWINTHGITHPVLSDPSGTIYSLFGDNFVPYNAILDDVQVLHFTDSGFDEAAVIAKIEQLLPGVLAIEHEPLRDTEDASGTPFDVNCTVITPNNPIPNEMTLHWNYDGGPTFTEVTLTPVRDIYTYTAQIPAPPYETTVYYYLSAADDNGNNTSDPYVAPTELHSFYVGVDVVLPTIEHTPIGDMAVFGWPPTVSAVVDDNIGVDSVAVEFAINGGTVETVPMLPTRSGEYSADLFGSVALGDTVEYRIVAVDVAGSPNTATDPTTGNHELYIIEQIPALIFAAGTSPLSGNAIAAELDSFGVEYDRTTTLPSDCTLYRSIYVCLGMYGAHHVLSNAEGQALADFLDVGGRLYMEGGDTWAWDPATPVHPYFNIEGLNDGAGDAATIAGVTGTFTEGFSFDYNGGNSYVDHLRILGSAFEIFTNSLPAYVNGIAYDGGSYRTIGMSFEFGGLRDTAEPNTKHELMRQILDFFEFEEAHSIFVDGFESGDTSAWSNVAP